MVGAGAVIADGFGGVAPEENRAGVSDFLSECCRLFHRELQMFGGDFVDDLRGFVQIAHGNQCAARFE